MAIPTRDVGCAETTHGLVAQNNVLEQLVEGSADVYIAVGKRRAVVEHKGPARRGAALQTLVKRAFFPMANA